MNLLLTTAGGFEYFETQDRIAVWKSCKHIVENMPIEDIAGYLQFSHASALALIDAIVCIADDPPVASWRPFRSNLFQLGYALRLAEDVRNLPEHCAMRDGRKWRSIPFIIFHSVFDHELAIAARDSTHAKILFTPNADARFGMMQIQRIVDEYKDRVLDDYQRLGILVRFVRGHAQVLPALRRKDSIAESEYYYGPADRRNHSGWVTMKRDDDALRHDVEMFHQLIESNATETEMHKFLEEHPAFLMEARLGIPLSHSPNLLVPKNWKPDYSFTPILGPYNSAAAELMELKGPAEQILTERFHPGFTAKVHHAIDQVRDYDDYLRDPRNREAILRALGYLPERSNLAVLIGRDPKSSEQMEILQRRRGQVDVKVITYDEILQTQASQIQPRLIYDVRSI